VAAKMVLSFGGFGLSTFWWGMRARIFEHRPRFSGRLTSSFVALLGWLTCSLISLSIVKLDNLNCTYRQTLPTAHPPTTTMWILPALGYVGVILGFAFLTLAIGTYLRQLDGRIHMHSSTNTAQHRAYTTSRSSSKSTPSSPRSCSHSSSTASSASKSSCSSSTASPSV
jgi:hypothetical protein